MAKSPGSNVPLDGPHFLEQLIAEGLVIPASTAKKTRTASPIKATDTVSDLVAEQRH